ncbi:MAG: c-type cytochrome [Kangiellaceae bacterium]|nr:c-type cytochrome [Kangiellaceae bacterium]
MHIFKLFLVVFLFATITSVSADHLEKHSIENRIKPSGSVYLEGDDVPVSKPAVVESSGPRTAEDIYKVSCAACHATDAIGAPMFGNAASWADRIAKGEEALINNAINGINAMPPMGTCGSCSTDDIAATVKYMVENSQ